MATEQTNEQLKKVNDLITGIKIATLVTMSQEGFKGRPMSTSDVDDNGNLWFFTNAYTEKVEEILEDRSVFLSYANPSENTYVMVSGEGVIVNDKAKMEALWEPGLKEWFPEGLQDPRMRLLKVLPKEIEYWGGDSGKLATGFKMLKAILTGKEYKDDAHDKIQLPS